MEELDWANDPRWTAGDWMPTATWDEMADLTEHIPLGVLVEAGRVNYYQIRNAVQITEDGAQNLIVMLFGWVGDEDDQLRVKSVTLGDDAEVAAFANALMNVMIQSNPKLEAMVGAVRAVMNEAGLGGDDHGGSPG